jgi:hypothetical protein
LYENNNNTQQPIYISFEANLPSITKEISTITPSFQEKLSIIPVSILGIFEILGGLIVLLLEILVFDMAVGLWCGFIYVLAGVAAVVLGLLLIPKNENHNFYLISTWYRS